jgi:hypothetical protein
MSKAVGKSDSTEITFWNIIWSSRRNSSHLPQTFHYIICYIKPHRPAAYEPSITPKERLRWFQTTVWATELTIRALLPIVANFHQMSKKILGC